MKLLTANETAKILKVTPGRIRQLLTAGRLKGIKFGRDWAINLKDIDAVRYRPFGRPRINK